MIQSKRKRTEVHQVAYRCNNRLFRNRGLTYGKLIEWKALPLEKKVQQEITEITIIQVAMRYFEDEQGNKYVLTPETDENGAIYYNEYAGDYTSERRVYENKADVERYIARMIFVSEMSWGQFEGKLKALPLHVMKHVKAVVESGEVPEDPTENIYKLICETVAETTHGLSSICSDGEQILCKTESAADAIADIFDAFGYVSCTGYYESVGDQYDGWYYVNV